MVALGIAVLVASLMGSLHCVGMCGPLALWATGGGQHRGTITAYHVGRLSTYLLAGLLAGLLGSAVNMGGDMAGYQMTAAKLAGGLLVMVGVHRLLSLHPRWRFAAGGENPSRVAALLQKAKPLLVNSGPRGKAYLGGLLTTWLPCGWLYLFVLFAAGTGGIATALTVMTAFWVGTLPALTAVWFGARNIVPKLGTSLPLIAGLLLIITGLYTATGRAAADLSQMLPPPMAAQPSLLDQGIEVTSLTDLVDQPLPCCEAATQASSDKPATGDAATVSDEDESRPDSGQHP
jgi:sulfite exporter TauE/SafE